MADLTTALLFFPSPKPTMCAVQCLVAQSCPTLCDPMDYNLPGSSSHGNSPGENTGVGCHAFLQGNLSNPGIEPWSSALQEDSLQTEPPGKPPKPTTRHQKDIFYYFINF